jgi:hypothetical protein
MCQIIKQQKNETEMETLVTGRQRFGESVKFLLDLPFPQ